MISSQQIPINQEYETILIDDLSTAGLKAIKSQMNSLVEYCKSMGKALVIDNLDEFRDYEHKISCHHHIRTCSREDHPTGELLNYLKSVQSNFSQYQPQIRARRKVIIRYYFMNSI